MKRAFILFCVFLCATFVKSQISHGGQPADWNIQGKKFSGIPFVVLELPAALAPTLEQKQITSLQGFKYGEQLFTDVDILADGDWETTNSSKICRFEVRSPNAEMISLQFSEYELADGASLFIYNTSRTHYIGSFTKENNKTTGDLATAVVQGDAVMIEYQEPNWASQRSKLRLGSITHGYVDIFDLNGHKDYNPGYQSSPCHNNVICPSASDWQNEKRAVCMFLRPSGDGCTGTLVNNTANDGTPYFYFANHCYQPNESQWVFYFNYESPGCVGSSGPSHQTLTGGTLRASDYFDDFALLEMSSMPPASYNAYYAGWDNSGNNPTHQTVIHHPLYDVKKITFDNNPAYSYSSGGTNMWGVTWDDGIVEPVSSGSPLFDQDHRIIGHMTEGANNCGGPYNTGCAKFSYSWDGPGSSNRLRDWLDPGNNTTVLDGFDPNASAASVSVDLRAMLQGPYDQSSTRMDDDLRSAGLVPLSEPYTALGYSFVGGGGESINASVLNTTGVNAIVDWVVVELRDKNDASSIVASRAALIQRDGDVVDLDGTSTVEFPISADDRYIALRHRNHLGVMTLNTTMVDDTPTLIDLTTGGVAMYGTEAMVNISGVYALWSGDVTMDGELKYTGPDNDRDDILIYIGGAVPTATASGYASEDVNLDGTIKYTGLDNDRDGVLQNIGGSVPTDTRQEQLP